MFIERDGNRRCPKTIILILIGIAICLTIGCAFLYFFILFHAGGAEDWSYSRLPGDYEIWRINSSNITLVKNKGDGIGENIVDGYISAFTSNDIYIAVEQIQNSQKALDVLDDDTSCYYIVNTETGDLIGPCTEKEYLALCEDKGLVFPNWIKTVPTPEGASFD